MTEPIQKLVEECSSWQKAKKNLVTLSKCSLDEKQKLVYPPIIGLTVEHLRGEREDRGYAVKTYTEFLLRELVDDGELAAKLYVALDGPISMAPSDWNKGLYFYEFVGQARDPRAQAVLRNSPGFGRWADAVIAVDGHGLSDEILSRVTSKKGIERVSLSVAAGHFCGAQARGALDALFLKSGHLQPTVALGIALLADPNDEKWFKNLSTSGHGGSAKRLFTALAGTRLGVRLKAIDTMTRSVRKEETPVAILVGLCRLLEDELPEIVEGAALALREHSRLGKKASKVHHALFLRMASTAAARGLTKKARKALDGVVKTIPRSKPLTRSSELEPTNRQPPKKKITAATVLRARSPETEARLLMAIRASPTDDGPRLVYADWLSEHQDLRGEFIQIQCLLGRAIWGAKGEVRESNQDVPNADVLEKREAKLYQKHRKRWMAPIAVAIRKWRWRRGFIEGFTAGSNFFEHASSIFASHPIVELSFEGLKRADFASFASTPLPGLKSLEFAHQRINLGLLTTLLNAPSIRPIEHLNLKGNSFGADGAEAIATSLPPNLKRLGIAFCEIDRASLTKILDASGPSLEAVCVGCHELSDVDLRAIRKHPRAALVRVVDWNDPLGLSTPAIAKG